ncbi:MAG: hypothetical protein Q4C54_08570 [Clostridia bacterium]|nr:hypothetical protein [Clostridia bacterium]
MRKLISLLLLLCLFLSSAAMAEDDPVLTGYLAFAQEGVEGMQQTDSLWVKTMMQHAQLTNIKYLGTNGYVQADLMLPKLLCNTKADTVAEAMAEYFQPTKYETYQFTATWQKDAAGNITYKWGMHSPTKLAGAITNQAAVAKRGYTSPEFRALLQKELLPQTARMPEKEDKEYVADFKPLPDGFAANAAKALGLTEEQAARRLQVPMMLMNITKINLDKGLEEASVTMRVWPWKTLMDRAMPGAKAELDETLGAPEMTRDEVEAIYCRHLADKLNACYYAKRNKTEEFTWTMDVTQVAADGLCASGDLLTYLGDMMAYLDAKVDELCGYAKTLPYYPAVDMADTCLFSGDVKEGTMVTFDTGKSGKHAYLVVMQGGNELCRGFVHSKVPLTIRLAPGQYEAAYGLGNDWHGERYVFGTDGEYGRFTFTVDEAGRTIVHMENTNGPLTTTPLTWQDLGILREPAAK